MKKLNIAVLAAVCFVAASCGGNSSNQTSSSAATGQEEKTAVADEPQAIDPNAKVVEITIAGDDAMKFDLSEITVNEGETVKLTLKHTGTFEKKQMGHNFVLLKEGVDVADFGAKAMEASATEYIPTSEKANIIAHTKLIGGGESDTIEFAAPKKGTYDFLCSFPGHYGIMKGKFIVK